MALEPSKHVNGRMWPPGQQVINGRPVGSRTAFSAGFLKDLAEVWVSHGKDTMIRTAQDQPSVFFATCARLIGQVKITLEQSLHGKLSAQDWAIMREIVDTFWHIGSQLPINRRKQKKWLLSQANM